MAQQANESHADRVCVGAQRPGVAQFDCVTVNHDAKLPLQRELCKRLLLVSGAPNAPLDPGQWPAGQPLVRSYTVVPPTVFAVKVEVTHVWIWYAVDVSAAVEPMNPLPAAM